MSTEAQNSKDLSKGIDRGRIYRIVPDGSPAPKPIKLGSASSAELVHELENPVVWWRRTAQRLLVDRKAVDVAPDLVRLVHQSQSAVGRLHALWTLDGLGKLEAPEIEAGLADKEAGVRENAIILAESRLAKNPKLTGELLGMVHDPDAKVRFQLLCTLGSLKSPQAGAARDQLLTRDVEDKWFQIAALSASSEEATRLYAKAVTGETQETPGRTTFIRLAASAVGARRKPAEIQTVIEKVARAEQNGAEWWRAASLEGLALGMRGKAATPAGFTASQTLLLKLFGSSQVTVRRAALRLIDFTGLPSGAAASSAPAHAATTAAGKQAHPEVRADAIGLLALAGPQ